MMQLVNQLGDNLFGSVTLVLKGFRMLTHDFLYCNVRQFSNMPNKHFFHPFILAETSVTIKISPKSIKVAQK